MHPTCLLVLTQTKIEQMHARVLHAKTTAMDLKPVKVKPMTGSMCILGTLADC